MAIVHKAIPLMSGQYLNFSVVGSTTAPANHKENTIWVNTETKITKWSLDGKEPASPIDGQVWIQILNSGGSVIFNALKKQHIIDTQLYAAYRWDGNEWIKKEAYYYYDEIWQQFSFLSSNIFTITARATKNTKTPSVSNIITNTDDHTVVVIDSVVATGGNYGENRAKLYIDDVVVLDTGKQSTTANYKAVANAWSGSFPISQNGSIYADVYTTRNNDIDDHTNPINITVNFHFE